jgi:hypothetical protein|tara:strand:+ start:292904 stop:293179 length:276 start_codon:yes stop_codon:yes gene_type:complete
MPFLDSKVYYWVCDVSPCVHTSEYIYTTRSEIVPTGWSKIWMEGDHRKVICPRCTLLAKEGRLGRGSMGQIIILPEEEANSSDLTIEVVNG